MSEPSWTGTLAEAEGNAPIWRAIETLWTMRPSFIDLPQGRFRLTRVSVGAKVELFGDLATPEAGRTGK